MDITAALANLRADIEEPTQERWTDAQLTQKIITSKRFYGQKIADINENYFYTVRSTPANIVAGTAEIALPSDFRKLKFPEILDGTTWKELHKIRPEEKYKYASSGFPENYFLQGNSVVLVPPPNISITGGMREHYIKQLNSSDLTDFPEAYHDMVVLRTVLMCKALSDDNIKELSVMLKTMEDAFEDDVFNRVLKAKTVNNVDED